MFVDQLLTRLEEGSPARGVYDEARGYTLVEGEPLVASAAWETATETKIGGEPRDSDAWAATTTITRVARESDDAD